MKKNLYPIESKPGIYAIVNYIDNKLYVGSSVNIKRRLGRHILELKQNKHGNRYLQRVFNKYGEDSFFFSDLVYCSISELGKMENYYIRLFDSTNYKKGYNLQHVDEYRKNSYSQEERIRLSKQVLKRFGNFTKFKSINVETLEERIFESLIEASTYILDGEFSTSNSNIIRNTVSKLLRGSDVYKGKEKGSLYKHKWEIIN